MNMISDRFVRGILIIAGTFFVGIGLIGVFIPLLPTTPFLLLAAACYARGSRRFYNWLLNNKWFGKYVKNYREGKGISAKAKLFTLILLWLTIGYSVILIVHIFWIKLILILIAVGVTLHVLAIKTLKD